MSFRKKKKEEEERRKRSKVGRGQEGEREKKTPIWEPKTPNTFNSPSAVTEMKEVGNDSP